MLVSESLKISETFFSIQGESTWVGVPTFFVRLTGCPLRCTYCDTEYAFTGGQTFSFAQLINQLKDAGASWVCVTGGEPLAQPSVIPFLERLCDMHYKVSLETSGALSLAEVDPRVKKVMDLKTPRSGEVSKNDYQNLEYLGAEDELKFVICDRLDYEWFKQKYVELNLSERLCTVLLSPSHNQVSPKSLSEWILADALPVRLQVQLHKFIWGDTPGH